MEAARLLLGDFDLEAAHDSQRGLLVLRVADVEAAGGALQLPSPPRSPSASPVRSHSSTSRPRSRSWRRSPAHRPPTPPPPPVRRESEPMRPPPSHAPAAPGRRRRRRGNRAGKRERDRCVARAANRAPPLSAPGPPTRLAHYSGRARCAATPLLLPTLLRPPRLQALLRPPTAFPHPRSPAHRSFCSRSLTPSLHPPQECAPAQERR